MPADATLLANDARPVEGSTKRQLHHPFSERLPVFLAEDEAPPKVPVCLERVDRRVGQLDNALAPALRQAGNPAPDGLPDVKGPLPEIQVAPLKPDQLPLPQPRLQGYEQQRPPFRLVRSDELLDFLEGEEVESGLRQLPEELQRGACGMTRCSSASDSSLLRAVKTLLIVFRLRVWARPLRACGRLPAWRLPSGNELRRPPVGPADPDGHPAGSSSLLGDTEGRRDDQFGGGQLSNVPQTWQVLLEENLLVQPRLLAHPKLPEQHLSPSPPHA